MAFGDLTLLRLHHVIVFLLLLQSHRGAASKPFIGVVSEKKGYAVLQCKSTGWYPEPEVFWLDGEGNLLSAGPTETVRGPDDLYTVSSRVTVEKRHSNSFTCRVQQNSTNQIRETKIHVLADFSAVQSYSDLNWINIFPVVCFFIIITLIIIRIKELEKELQSKKGHQMMNLKNLIKKGSESSIVTGQKKKLEKTESED